MKPIRLGGYRLLSEIGSGAMATVYLAEATCGARSFPPGERVALKVVHPHLHGSETLLERFLQEAREGRRIRHENVVRTLDVGTDLLDGETRYFLVMEYVEGQTLRALLEELGRLPEELLRHVGREVAKALAAIHSRGIIHRDLKPENVLITQDEVVKVMDLGLARLKDEAGRLTGFGQFVGSVGYAAPEQFREGGESVDGRADLYALGVLLFELATGERPFHDPDLAMVIRKQLQEEPRRPSRLDPQLSPFLEELILRLLRKEPGERFAAAGEVERVLAEGEESAWWRARAEEIRRETKRPLRRMRIPRETALVGRAPELALLRESWGKAARGEGRAVLLQGEAGIGKTRLVDEFAALLEREGEDLSFLFGAYPPGGIAAGARAFSNAFLEHLTEGALDARLGELLPESPGLVPGFAAILRGLPLPIPGPPIDRETILTLFVRMTRALSGEHPVLLLIDDLHYAPEEGRALFASLAHAVGDCRVLLVGTARPGLPAAYVATLTRLPHLSPIDLARLTREDVRLILREALGPGSAAEDLAGPVADGSDGNPLFVFEILAELREEGILRPRSDGTWERKGPVAGHLAPHSVRGLVRSRLGLLDERDRELLEVAACLGFEFDPSLLAEAADLGRIPTLKRLSRMERSHGIVRSLGRVFRFDHPQIQEGLCGGLPVLLREEYHTAVGNALQAREEAAGRRPEDTVGEAACRLCRHFLEGVTGERALPYLERSIEYLESAHRNQQALELADLALSRPGLLRGSRRAGLLLVHTRLGRLLGCAARPETALHEAIRLFEEAGEYEGSVAAHRELARLSWERGDPDRAVVTIRQAAEIAARSLAPPARGPLLGDLGNVCSQLGRYDEARGHFRRYLEIAREHGDRAGEAAAVGSLGLNAFETGDLQAARTHLEASLPAFREIGHLRGEATAVGNLGLVYLDLGLYDRARTSFERHLEITHLMGYRRGEANALGNLGMVEQAEGRSAAALERFERDLAIRREIGDRLGEGLALQLRGNLYLSLGAWEQSRADLERSLEILERQRFSWGAVTTIRRIALLLDELDRGEAETWFRRAEGLAREIGHRSALSGALVRLGRFCLRRGRRKEARRLLHEGREVAEEIPARADIVLARAALALCGEGVGSAREALEHHGSRITLASRMEARFLLYRVAAEAGDLREALRLLDHLEEHAPPEHRRSLVEAVRLHREIRSAGRKQPA